MAYSRYSKRELILNDDRGYKEEFFTEKGIDQVVQYGTPIMKYPTNEEMAGMNLTQIVWEATDKLYNVAHEAYGSPELWWVIAWFNKKPTAADFKVGDVVFIPHPLQRVLDIFGV
jgi:hypothetical protein